MQTSLKLVVVAVVLLMTSVAVIFMFQGQAQVIPQFSDNQVDSRQCQLWKEEYRREVCQVDGNDGSDFRSAPTSSCSAPC